MNYLPFNSINKDRVYKAEDWAWYFSTFIGNGVFPKPMNGLMVTADEDMDIAIKAGYGFINGYAFRNQGDYIITLDTGDGVLGRIDRAVLRWSLADRSMVLAVKKGTPSASPVAPALTRNADIYELALADITVARGATAITQSSITDKRTDPNLCGIVEGTVSQIDWGQLTAQLNTFMAEYSQKVEDDYEEYTADMETYEEAFRQGMEGWKEDFQADSQEWQSGQITQMETWAGAFTDNMDDWQAEQWSAFREWLQSIQGLIDEDDLARLLALVESHEDRLTVLEYQYVANDFFTRILDDDDSPLVDDSENAIVGDWKWEYMGRTGL